MPQPAVLFGPIVDVREVLESFLKNGVLLPDWRDRLVGASQEIVELSRSAADGSRLADLGRQIADLARSDLEVNLRTRSVAHEVERLLDEVRVPGMPKPEDEDWSF